MSETFAEYINKRLKQSTVQGLNNPLVKMPIKRFRLLEPAEFSAIAQGGNLVIGTTSDPIVRNLYKNYNTRIRERGERSAFVCVGAIEMTIAAGTDQQPRTALFPVCLKRSSLEKTTDKITVTVSQDERWQVNPVLQTRLKLDFGITIASRLAENPENAIAWLKAQLGNRAISVQSDRYVGLFSSQQMVLQERLSEPTIRQALARNPVIQAKIAGTYVKGIELGDITDDGLEELGLILPCDDHQLRVIQLSTQGYSLQVEGPPGTGKSQTIANIISSAMFQGKTVLFVCDKKAAIVQVEERLANSGIKPALLNLHDEDLDKRDFLKQTTDKLPPGSYGSTPKPTSPHPLTQLPETRRSLNDRVRFGRAIAHPSLQVMKREALAGLIQLRKELVGGVPNISIFNWQSLSKERFEKLRNSVNEWPELADIVSDAHNVWNEVRPESFDDNPNAAREVHSRVQGTLAQIEALDELREMTATVGIELPVNTDQNVANILDLVITVINKPTCHPHIVGNPQFNIAELRYLQGQWKQRQELLAARYPVVLDAPYDPQAEQEAERLVAAEKATSWYDLTEHSKQLQTHINFIQESQSKYLRLCDQIGLVYSPLLKVRRAQFQAVLALGELKMAIPRMWWNPAVYPILMTEGWVGKLLTCINHEKAAPLPLHFLALERIASTHWKHVEAMAEHGFNVMSYVKRFLDDRKCKYALQQAYPSIPRRGFKGWREVTLHAVAARSMMQALRAASDTHPILAHLTENYLAAAHEPEAKAHEFSEHADVRHLRQVGALVQQWRDRNDLFEVGSVHWQTSWEATNLRLLQQVESALTELDNFVLPDPRSDDIDEAVNSFEKAYRRIQNFFQACETSDGDRTLGVQASFTAQKNFALCQANLAPLPRYSALFASGPDWVQLEKALIWRDRFETLSGNQKLDIDSSLWVKLRDRIQRHQDTMRAAYKELGSFFEGYPVNTENGTPHLKAFGELHDYSSLTKALQDIDADLPRHPLWLEKKRWQKKLAAFPELKELWGKVIEGSIHPSQAERLFCFNLLRLANPIAKPQGPELKQVLNTFAEQDDNLSLWILELLKGRLQLSMSDAARNFSQSEAELRRLAGMQRIRGTVRELIAANLDYLLAAKQCWMMSPTSLANLLCGNDNNGSSTDIFQKHDIPFDLVIFDEASQIRVMDGLLSMAFGKQVIIVGDKHQLPPTNFFLGLEDSDSDSDPSDFGTSESLLNEFEGVFQEEKTYVMLMSHYRSETPDLIRFSNNWFYSGRLEMYPPARVAGIGRRLHYVPNAVYTAGQSINRVEAQEVVKLIELHVHENPTKSLGVVTMNIQQMELIDDLLQSTPQAVQAFYADESKFFLRNLETVQGDEMDRIIISLTYGKSQAGQFNASVLGPLIRSGGERRLNVAITRCRNGMTVVSSLRVADLAASNAQSNGFKCLKALLGDLESAEQARDYGISSRRFERRLDGVSNIVHCESPFEEQVVEFLENQGYELECQYGDGGFRLDIVVKERGRNLLAIECDGAAYHSSLVARTRDRAREKILAGRGWRVHRVWSTNWWFYEQQEKQAIIDAINVSRNGRVE